MIQMAYILQLYYRLFFLTSNFIADCFDPIRQHGNLWIKRKKNNLYTDGQPQEAKP